MFHNHSDGGPESAMVALPDQNRSNRWSFHQSGYTIDESYFKTLVALKPEGLYRATAHFHPDNERVVAANALVQLGYNREGEAIIFFPTEAGDSNAIAFPARGMKIPPAIYNLLQRLDLRGPHVQPNVH